MNTFPLLVLAAALATNVASAQCLFANVAGVTIGPSCNLPSSGFCKLLPPPTALVSSLDTGNCTLTVHVEAFSGCGASVPIRALAIGLQNAAIPLPEFGLGCALHLLPVAMLVGTSGPFVLQLPQGVASLGFLMQGAAFSQAPQGTSSLTFSDGIAITLQ
jgi:hypothetical protein